MEQSTRFLTHTLPNGMPVVGQPMSGVESVAFGFLVGTGARDERLEDAGVTHFTEQMLFRGTQQLDARALVDRFDSLGISYDASAGLEMTLVSAVLVGDRLPQAVDLLTDVVRDPSFPEDEMDSVRTLIEQERRQREDRPAQKVMEAVRQNFYRGSPLQHDVLGTAESVRAMTHAQLERYWRDRFTANNIIISLAGNFDWQASLDQLAEKTAGWWDGAGRLQLAAPTPQSALTIMQREASQENIAFAFPGLPITDERYYALACAIQALGGGSNSRLFREVREKRGLAYSVQARYDALEKTGIVRVYCGTSGERAHESVEVIMAELRKLEESGITDDELTLAKTRLKSQLIMRSESSSARLVANLRSWWFEERLRSLQEISDDIDRVTIDRVGDVVGAIGITSNLAAAAVGPRTKDELFAGALVG